VNDSTSLVKLKNGRVLVVDDNEAIHKDFRKILASPTPPNPALESTGALLLNREPAAEPEPGPFEIDTASQGREALEMVRRAESAGRPFAVAFIDMRLPPGRDGLDTIEHVWRESPDLQVVICTAYSDYSWDQIARRLGNASQWLILKKPFDAIEVRQLACALTEKWQLAKRARAKMDQMADMVRTRTSELEKAHVELLNVNRRLKSARDTAESANRSKTEFLANVSHEIRTPLTAILGYAELLDERTTHHHAPDEQGEAVDAIFRNGRHLLSIVNDVLDLSKIEAGKLDVHAAVCDVAEMLDDVLASMHIRAEGKGLSLTCKIDVGVPDFVRTDPVRVRQILTNLLGNAIKFTDRGGVHLRTSLVDGDRGGSLLQFDVSDTGIGMDAHQIGSLFQPFVQADATLTRSHGGSGLGLAICRRLARMLGGDVVIAQSAAGKGSTFRATISVGETGDGSPAEHQIDTGLPETRQSVQNAPPSHGEQVSRRGADSAAKRPQPLRGRVLLVEDGPDNQRLIGTILEKAGAEVQVAENGQLGCEAVADARGKPFDVILMDMQMPVMNGFEATRKLRCEGYAGPIIALTAHATPQDRQMCLEAGCNQHVAKPLRRNELLELLARHVGPRSVDTT